MIKLIQGFMYLTILAIAALYGLFIYLVIWLLAQIGFPMLLLYIGGGFAYFLLLIPTLFWVLAISVGLSDN